MERFLNGKMVRLRPLENEADRRALYEMWNDPASVGEHLAYDVCDWDGFCKFINNLEKAPNQPTFLLIVKNDGGEAVGFVQHFWPRPWRYMIEIGYELLPKYRGRGYASEGVRLLIDYLFSNRPLERIEAITGAKNLPSQRLLERLGFKLEGRTRKSFFVRGEYVDSLLYGLLREDWTSRPSS